MKIPPVREGKETGKEKGERKKRKEGKTENSIQFRESYLPFGCRIYIYVYVCLVFNLFSFFPLNKVLFTMYHARKNSLVFYFYSKIDSFSAKKSSKRQDVLSICQLVMADFR